jgi:hypothetical protein
MPAGVSAYTALANVTLGSSAASVTFSSINSGYRDLVLIIQGSSLSGNFVPKLQFNNDTGANYNDVYMTGNGSSAASSSNSSDTALRLYQNAFYTSTTLAQTICNILDYSATDKHKSTLTRNNNASQATETFAGRWANTAAISTIKLFSPNATSLAAGSTVALYGVSA